jgi:hypothetical protein
VVVSDDRYRQKVLQPRPGFRREDWSPIPTLNWASQQSRFSLQEQTKLFMRLFMAAVAETVAAERRGEFVALFGVATGTQGVELSLVCPHEAPLELLKTTDARRDLPHAADMEIEWRFAALDGKRVPVVVECDRAADRYAFNNFNQLEDPRQFMNPYWCRTTSGLLNAIGATDIAEQELIVLSNLDALQDEGLDEWFRWLYYTRETGRLFESERLLIRRLDPEKWIYDYDGS